VNKGRYSKVSQRLLEWNVVIYGRFLRTQAVAADRDINASPGAGF
jgi:hypothetical protein